MKLINMPQLIRDDVPREKRLELLRAIGTRAKEEFDHKYPAISGWFKDYDALYLLSYCACYFLSQPEGIDLEVSGRMRFYHHYLEIMQAFSLSQGRALTAKPLLQDASRIEQLMQEIGNAMGLRFLNIPPELNDEAELDAYRLRIEMMNRTTAIRNWAYPDQIKRIVLSLAGAISTPFRKVYGVDPVDLANLLFSLTDERSELLNAHRAKLRPVIRAHDHNAIIDAYNAAFPENERIEGAAVEAIWEQAGRKRRNLVGMLITHSDLKLERIYSFTLDHAVELLANRVPSEVLSDVLDKLAYEFGDLRDFDKEHIILGNPVWNRPFIRVGDGQYYSAIWGIMPHLTLELLEDLIWLDGELRAAYTEAKAEFLEDEVERLFKQGFPNASIYRGSLWTDKVTGKDFENDLTVVLDTFAIVIEAKSGVVTDPAKRGAPKRLFETLRGLIEEPSEQALRFIDHLTHNQQVHTFQTKRGGTNTIDSRAIKYYIPLGITLSHLGMISSNLKKLIDAKVVTRELEQLAPSMSVTDLEDVFELLPLEFQKLHYLARRREFEAHMTYEGDELDLLGFYLDNGFNIGDTEYKRDTAINMVMKSKELDPYFVAKSEGKTIEKPQLSMTKWWEELLTAISAKRMQGWAEMGFILLNSTKDDQSKFERMFRELMRRIRQGKADKPHNWVMFASGPERRRYLIAGYPYTTKDKEVRNGIMAEIISDENLGNARGAVVIGVQMDRMDYPYSVLARRAATNLFDTLTLDEPKHGQVPTTG